MELTGVIHTAFILGIMIPDGIVRASKGIDHRVSTFCFHRTTEFWSSDVPHSDRRMEFWEAGHIAFLME